MMSFEGLMLVLRMDTAIKVYIVQDGRFVLYGHLPSDFVQVACTWLAQAGYERAVSVEPDDGVSGLYHPMNQGPVPARQGTGKQTTDQPG